MVRVIVRMFISSFFFLSSVTKEISLMADDQFFICWGSWLNMVNHRGRSLSVLIRFSLLSSVWFGHIQSFLVMFASGCFWRFLAILKVGFGHFQSFLIMFSLVYFWIFWISYSTTSSNLARCGQFSSRLVTFGHF